MSENGMAPSPPDDDRTPTQDDVVAPEKPWVMPEPVFRQSSGYTPKATAANRPEDSEVDTLAGDKIIDPENDEANAAPDAGGTAAIAEQPNIAEDIPAETASENIGARPAPNKGGFWRLLLIIVGVGLVVLAVVGAILVAVSWYFLQVSESQNLN